MPTRLVAWLVLKGLKLLRQKAQNVITACITFCMHEKWCNYLAAGKNRTVRYLGLLWYFYSPCTLRKFISCFQFLNFDDLYSTMGVKTTTY